MRPRRSCADIDAKAFISFGQKDVYKKPVSTTALAPCHGIEKGVIEK